MGLKKWLADLFKSEYKKPNYHQYTKRRYVESVKAGQNITVEWKKIVGRIGTLKCINNDPLTRKIFLKATWGNKEVIGRDCDYVILDYSSVELKNFNLLNPINEEEDIVDETDISFLQKQMNDALKKEEYEIAREIQNKIDKILKK